MSKAGTLTRNPTLLTAVLSLAALAGYVSYRLTLGAAAPAASAHEEAGHDHAHDMADALPDLEFPDLAGQPVALADFAGQPQLINFWATWCAPCLREIPLLKAFHEEQAGIGVIGIAVDRREAVLEYAETMQFNYPVLIDQVVGFEAMSVFRNDAGAMPFSVLTAPDGAVLGTHAGELDADHLEEFRATLAALAAGSIDRAGARERLAGHD